MSSPPLAVVTGTSGGIGGATAARLVRAGFDVIATVRRAGTAPAGTHEVVVDLTDADATRALVDAVGARPLQVLINNAGITVPGPVETTPLEAWRRQLEINLLAHIAVIQALLPSLRAAGGRIVNISSVAGRVVAPGLGPYGASKFALEAVSDALRRELDDVAVILIEPGMTDTPIWAEGRKRGKELEDQMLPDQRTRYRPLIDALGRASARGAEHGMPVDDVADVIVKAAQVASPQTRYLVGKEARRIGWLVRILPDRMLDRGIKRGMGLSSSSAGR